MGKHRLVRQAGSTPLDSIYARYVGRVGALAVALGVGVVVATTSGVALADELGPAPDSASGADRDATPGPNVPSGSGAGASGSGTLGAAGEHAELVDDDDGNSHSITTVTVGNSPTVIFDNSGGAHTSEQDKNTKPDDVEPTKTQAPSADPAPSSMAPTSTSPISPPAALGVESQTTETGSASRHDASVASVADDHPRSELSAAEDVSIHDEFESPTENTQFARTFSLAATGPGAAAVDPSTLITLPPPTVTTPPPPSPIEVLVALPGNLIRFATELVSAALAPFFGLGPTAPSAPDTPVLWAVLAFVRRQFFNASPTLTPSGQTADPTTGQLYGSVGVADGDGDPVQLTVLQGPAHGSISLDEAGNYVYKPIAGYVGTDSFTVAVSDEGSVPHVHGLAGLFGLGGGHASVATIGLTAVAVITDGTHAPSGSATATATNDLAASVIVTVTASDADGDEVTIAPPTPTAGTLAYLDSLVNDDGSTTYGYRFTPNPEARVAAYNTPGPDAETLRFSLSDGTHAPVSVPVNATISPIAATVTGLLAVGNGDVVQVLELFHNPADGHLCATVVRKTGDANSGPSFAVAVYDTSTNTLIRDGYGIGSTYDSPQAGFYAAVDDSAVDALSNIYHTVFVDQNASAPYPLVVMRPDGTNEVLFAGSEQSIPIALASSLDGTHVYTKILTRVDEQTLSVAIKDLSTGSSYDLGTIPTALGPSGPFSNIVVDSDGRVYAVDVSAPGSSGGLIVLETDGTVSTTPLGGTVLQLGSSKDGQHVYALVGGLDENGDSSVTLVDVITGTSIDVTGVPISQQNGAIASELAVSADGARVLLLGAGSLTVVDVNTGGVVPVFLGGATTGTDVFLGADATKGFIANGAGMGTIVTVALANSISPGDPSADGAITRAELENLVQSGAVEVSENEYGKVRVIDGTFTSMKVLTVEDAARVVNSVAGALGGVSGFASSDLIFQQDMVLPASASETETTAHFYRLVQTVNGIPVLGTQVILATDGDGTVTGLFSTYTAALLNVDTTPSSAFDEDSEAIAAAKSAIVDMLDGVPDQAAIDGFLETLTFQARPVIYDLDYDIAPRLAWQVEVFTTPTEEDFDPNAPQSEFVYFDTTYYVAANGVDAGQAIAIISASHELSASAPRINLYRATNVNQLPGTPDSSGARAATAYANMVRVYQYYQNVLGRTSFDGANGLIRISLLPTSLNNAAFYGLDDGRLGFRFGYNFENGIDAVGHEFTHGVIHYTARLAYTGESGALDESFGDIMGSLIENDPGWDRWLIAEDSGHIQRDMASPGSYGQPASYSYYDASRGVHYNSGIFNYAAYKMMVDPRTAGLSRDTWAKVFYGAMFRLQPNSKFAEGRAAVIASAKTLGLSREQQDAIKSAFDSVGIVEKDTVRIVLRWGNSPADLDSHLTGPSATGSGPRFHVWFLNPNYFKDGSISSSTSRLAADLDFDDTNGVGPESTTIRDLVAGDYYFYVHDYTDAGSSQSTALARSRATVDVRIVLRGQLAYNGVFQADGMSSGTTWSVFKLTISGPPENRAVRVTRLNTYSYLDPTVSL